MQTLVVKTWKANSEPIDEHGHYVLIHGRTAGIIAWILSLLKIDPTTMLRISADHIEFMETSLSGLKTRVIGLDKVSSTYYGYYKPWKLALAILFFSLNLAYGASASTYGFQSFINFTVVFLIGAAIAVAIYFLKRTLTLGFVEVSGVLNGIRFQRSVIENVNINEEQAAYICQLTQALIRERQKR